MAGSDDVYDDEEWLMPLLPMGPAVGAGGLAPPMGAPAPLLPPDVPPAGAGALALAPLAEQQQAALAAFKAQQVQQAQEAMALAMQAIAGVPNPAAMGAQSEPSPLVEAGPGQDPSMPAGY